MNGNIRLIIIGVMVVAMIGAGAFYYFTTQNKPTYSLSLQVTGSGSVSRSPDQPLYAQGTVVTLTATPSVGYTFTGWSVDSTGSTNPTSITINGNKSITAAFTQNQYTLTDLTVGSGSVAKNPSKKTYTYGESVQLTASPAAGYSFSGWSGDLSGLANPTTIRIDAAKSVTATFVEESAVITFTAPIQLLATSFSSESAQTTSYQVYAYASWDPAPYVRYYEVSLNYNNNSKPLQNTWVSADYNVWGSPGNELGPFPWTENMIYVIGPEGVQHPSGQPYRGRYDGEAAGTWLTVKKDGTKVFGPNMWENSKHGVKICGITATFKNDGSVSSASMIQVATDMQKFLTDYTRGWVVTLKNVS